MDENNDIEMKTVLKKSGENYQFISNKATKGADSLNGLVCG